MTTKNIWLKVAITAVLVGMTVSGCKSSNKQAVPSNDASVTDASNNGGSGGSGGAGGSTAGSGGAGGSTAGTGGSGGTAGTEMDASVPDDSSTAVNCDGPSGCYSCAPQTEPQFLNSCLPSFTCVHYDNGPLGVTPTTLPPIL
ncbi:MAG TPA: hypothetical protein VF331_27485 [Polyangiales bacterium]